MPGSSDSWTSSLLAAANPLVLPPQLLPDHEALGTLEQGADWAAHTRLP